MTHIKECAKEAPLILISFKISVIYNYPTERNSKYAHFPIESLRCFGKMAKSEAIKELYAYKDATKIRITFLSSEIDIFFLLYLMYSVYMILSHFFKKKLFTNIK